MKIILLKFVELLVDRQQLKFSFFEQYFSMKFVSLIFASFLAILFSSYLQNVSAQTSDVKLLPDWNTISLQELGSVGQDGQIGTEYNEVAGYEASREWTTGDNPEEVLKLGDLENSLSAQEFTLEEITNSSESNQITDSTNIPLSDFSLVGEQSIESLVEAVPNLGSASPSEVEPIANLLEQNGFIDYDVALDTLVAENEEIANLELGSISLEQYTVGSIPNLEQAQLGDFRRYKDSLVSEIPSLAQVPLGSYPSPITAVGDSVARIDFIWGGAESERHRTISGSYVEGFNVPCDSECEYLELDDVENVGASVQSDSEGKQWIAGREHWVAGGTGCLAGGRESTGIHPFGDSFKTVLWRTDETTDTGEIVMFFNIKTQCGSSAYFIGPIPFPMGSVSINDLVFVGTGI
jgi:hypothetical protein